ncbi:MAG: hypothetical protein R6X15_01085 [Pseudomonadota bacterium]
MTDVIKTVIELTMKETMQSTRILTALLAVFLLLPLGAQAAFKCWTNSEGVRECGNSIPPEYSQKSSETINERGITIERQTRAKTSEELEAERLRRAEEEKRKAEEERLREEQKNRDRVLLSSYLSEQDIIDTRDRMMDAINGSIEIRKLNIEKLEADLEKETQRAHRYEDSGKEIPEAVQKSIESLQRQINDKTQYIQSKEQEKEALRNKYNKDLKRFRELKADGQKL